MKWNRSKTGRRRYYFDSKVAGIKLRYFQDGWFPLFRYLSDQWVDKFFNTGLLRIGSLAYYQNMEDHGDGKADPTEGRYNAGTLDEPNYIEAYNTFMLCMSNKQTDRLAEEWKCGGLKINNVKFFEELTKALPIPCHAGTLDAVQYFDKSKPNEYARFGKDVPYVGDLKDLKFAYQNEVRMIWEPSISVPLFNDPTSGWRSKLEKEEPSLFYALQSKLDKTIDVHAPAAAKYCTRF